MNDYVKQSAETIEETLDKSVREAAQAVKNSTYSAIDSASSALERTGVVVRDKASQPAAAGADAARSLSQQINDQRLANVLIGVGIGLVAALFIGRRI